MINVKTDLRNYGAEGQTAEQRRSVISVDCCCLLSEMLVFTVLDFVGLCGGERGKARAVLQSSFPSLFDTFFFLSSTHSCWLCVTQKASTGTSCRARSLSESHDVALPLTKQKQLNGRIEAINKADTQWVEYNVLVVIILFSSL